MIRAQRAFALIEELCFERASATPGELKAARLLQQKLEELGVESRLEAFGQPWGRVKKVSLTTSDPAKQYPCAGYELSASTPDGGVDAPLLYVEKMQPLLLKKARGKIVLFHERLTPKAYRQLVDAGAAGFIASGGHFADDLPLPRCTLRGAQLFMPRIPGVFLHTRDAITLAASGAKNVRLELSLEEGMGQSHNVVADVRGTQCEDEIIAITAHYDTVPDVIGAYDNASGTAVAMELLRAFLNEPPRRTVRFIWCGSEETGLSGSLAYTDAHADELTNIKLVVNFDLAGAVLAEDHAVVMAEPALQDYLRYMALERGFPLRVDTSVLPSDATRFVDRGVPAVGFGRYGTETTATMHDRRDTTSFLSVRALAGTIDFSYAFVRRMANAYTVPVSCDIPDSLKEKITEYLFNRPPAKDGEV
jgi:Zn-dependent M28 family amino/carboxypeptidase